MEFRPLLKNEDRLRILVDSESILTLREKAKDLLTKLLEYHKSYPFEFLRTPLSTDFAGLKRIVEFKKKYVGKELDSIEIVDEKSTRQIGILSSKQIFESLQWSIFRKHSLDRYERDAIELILIQASINEPGDMGILVTNNGMLLGNRRRLEKNYPKKLLNIVTVEEAIEIMNIYAKHRGKYYIAGYYTANKGLWHWYNFRSRIPFYHVGDPILDAFAFRFIFAFMSLDEMAFQYYSEATWDSMQNTLYHFNYFISLVSGIFDNLAIRAFQQYQLDFKGMEFPSRISLNKKAGKNFLRALEEKSGALYRHVKNNDHFIKLIYALRELVIHREGLRTLSYTSYKEKVHYVRINNEINRIIDEMGDIKKNEESLSEWGVCERDNNLFLDPYIFSKSAIKLLVRFSTDYLQLLGFPNFIEELRGKDPGDNFVRATDTFKKYHLGF